MIKRASCTFILCSLCFLAPSQQSKVDSLIAVLKVSKEDTVKVIGLNDLGDRLWRTSQFTQADSVSRIALHLAENLGFRAGEASAYITLGLSKSDQGKYSEGLQYLTAALKINQEIGNKHGIAAAYGNLGLIYYEQGNYPEALKNQLADLKIAEEIQDKRLMANANTNIGNIYTEQGNYATALTYQSTNLKISEQLGDKKLIANAHNNIANNYYYQQNYTEASKNYFAALQLNQEIGNKKGAAIAYNNIGEVYSLQGNYEEALKNHFAALAIRKEIGDARGIASSCIALGTVYTKQKQFSEAGKYLDEALASSKKIGSKDKIKGSYQALALLDSARGNGSGAYEDYKMYILYRDSLLNENNTKKIVQAQMQYEFDKKEAIAKVEREKEEQQQRIILGAVAGGLLLVILFSVFLANRYRITRHQKKIIEEKNKDITDSINYALRIQQAFLPDREEIRAVFPRSFILFKCKDIVSGDFYAFHKSGSSSVLAAADCTGHGVPGAFMSLVGSERLTDAVQQSDQPGKILSLLNTGIKKALHQSDKEESTRDGMDIALCVVNPAARTLKYAGANRPLWIIRKGQTAVEEIKATKKAIGGLTEDNQAFDAHEVTLQPGDAFYLFSDGYADTFSGKNGKKLTTKRFKELLLSIQDHAMHEQGKILNDYIENWKGDTEQIDDILVIGVRM